MSIPVISIPVEKLVRLGLRIKETIHYQSPASDLIQDCLRRDEGSMSDTGALVIQTGAFTGRSPRDRFIVHDEITAATVDWNEVNQPLSEENYQIILKKMRDYLNRLPEIWIRDCMVCADPRYRLSFRVVTETPAMNLFAYNMFIRPSEDELAQFKTEWNLMSVPGLRLDPSSCGIRQQNAVIISFKHKMILIAGTGYTGETKKAIFSVLNYLLPIRDQVLPMHCSANMGPQGETAIFFGLSGTGKTTLSTDASRKLIGDDEHGWSPDGIFNFEGGCYAKCIHLDRDKEPAIYDAIRPGALLENVRFYAGTDQINFDDGSITENTRVSYPLENIDNALEPAIARPPKNIFFLTCDASGVLPPVSRLTASQAMYQFISGYTAKVAGTETGIKEPKSTFSACFGAPFLPLHPGRYAQMLGDKMKEQGAKVWLLNTGWTGGPLGVGDRMKLSHTRAIISAVLKTGLEEVDYIKEAVFGFDVPLRCPGVPAGLLDPRGTWKDPAAYDQAALMLARKFKINFFGFTTGVPAEAREGGPII